MIQERLANQLSSPACENSVRMISCGADKSIYFRTAHKVRHVPIDLKLLNTVFWDINSSQSNRIFPYF